MTCGLLEGHQVKPIALLFLNHTRGFNHASDESCTDSDPILGGHRRAPQSQSRNPVPSVSDPDLGSMILPPLSMDLGLLMISIGAVNLWRARQKST